MTRRNFLPALLLATVTNAPVGAADPRPVPDTEFDTVMKMIRRQKGEWTWAEVPWLINFPDAQKRAVSEGKPIFMATCAQGSLCGQL